jgi:hypothetical protein
MKTRNVQKHQKATFRNKKKTQKLCIAYRRQIQKHHKLLPLFQTLNITVLLRERTQIEEFQLP